MARTIRSVGSLSRFSERADAGAELLGRQLRPIQTDTLARSLVLLVIFHVETQIGILVRHGAVRMPPIAPIAFYWRRVRQPKSRGVYIAIWRLLFDDGNWM